MIRDHNSLHRSGRHFGPRTVFSTYTCDTVCHAYAEMLHELAVSRPFGNRRKRNPCLVFISIKSEVPCNGKLESDMWEEGRCLKLFLRETVTDNCRASPPCSGKHLEKCDHALNLSMSENSDQLLLSQRSLTSSAALRPGASRETKCVRWVRFLEPSDKVETIRSTVLADLDKSPMRSHQEVT